MLTSLPSFTHCFRTRYNNAFHCIEIYTLAATSPQSTPILVFCFNCRNVCTLRLVLTYLIRNGQYVNSLPNLDFDFGDPGDLSHEYP